LLTSMRRLRRRPVEGISKLAHLNGANARHRAAYNGCNLSL
jgi:hypothetical protein